MQLESDRCLFGLRGIDNTLPHNSLPGLLLLPSGTWPDSILRVLNQVHPIMNTLITSYPFLDLYNGNPQPRTPTTLHDTSMLNYKPQRYNVAFFCESIKIKENLYLIKEQLYTWLIIDCILYFCYRVLLVRVRSIASLMNPFLMVRSTPNRCESWSRTIKEQWWLAYEASKTRDFIHTLFLGKLHKIGTSQNACNFTFNILIFRKDRFRYMLLVLR